MNVNFEFAWLVIFGGDTEGLGAGEVGGGGNGGGGGDREEPAPLMTPDYSEKRILPISIPDYTQVMPVASGAASGAPRGSYIVYNIYMAGRHLCSRRYSFVGFPWNF